MRVQIFDPDGLLASPQTEPTARDPRLLHVFADEAITKTRIPLSIAPSLTFANAFEATTVIPVNMQWNVGMSSTLARLLNSDGQNYESNTPIPRPASFGDDEVVATFTLRRR